MLRVLTEMVPMLKVRLAEEPRVPTAISPPTVSEPPLILPTVTFPPWTVRLFAVAPVAPSTMALVLVIIASSPDEGTPMDQFPAVNQLPAVLEIQLSVAAQAELPWLANMITSTTPAERTRAKSHPQVRIDSLTRRCLITILRS